MTSTVLVPMDERSSSVTALEFALSEYPDADITVIYSIGVVDSADGLGRLRGETRNRYLEAESTADRVLADAESRASEADVALETDVAFGPPPQVIPEYASTHGIDHIVMGDHGMAGSKQLVNGTVPEMVVRRASVPVTVVRDPDER